MHRSRRVFAASVSVSMALGTGVAVAHAATPSVLYVNNNASADCTDTGSGAGSSATPFCTIQAAANAAVAGDDVDIYSGMYDGAVVISASGTANAPITFQPADNGVIEIGDGSGQTGPALTFDNASYVGFDGDLSLGSTSPFRAPGIFMESAVVNGSSHITLDGINPASTAANYSVQVNGNSSDVSLTRSTLNGPNAGVLIEPGSSGDVISTNEITDDAAGIEVDGASNTAITSNTLWGQSSNDDQINVSDSTGTSIENNIVTYPGTVAGSGAAISVDSNSATSTTEDYNVVWPDAQGTSTVLDSAYSWAGANYSSQASFNQVTGQGAHDLVADPYLQPDAQDEPFSVHATAPQFNSANDSAPGMLAEDLYGTACQSDPVAAITGAGPTPYCERGAVQQKFATPTSSDGVTTEGSLRAELSTSISATFEAEGGSFNVSPAPTPAVSHVVNWGDGTTSTLASVTATYTTMTHTYAKLGTYTITDTTKLPTGGTVVNSRSYTASAFPPLPQYVYALGPNKASVQEWMGPETGWMIIGGPASALYAGVLGVFAVSPDGSAIYEYDGASGTWTKIGGAGAQFAVAGDSLYGLAPNRSYVARWNGSGTGWTVIGGPAQAIYPTESSVFATSPGNKAIFQYASGSWTQVGGAAAQFATAGNMLYGLGPNNSYVSAWSGSKWTVIGGPASRIYAGAAGMFAVDPGNTAIYQFGAPSNTWTKVGGGGTAFAVSQNLFGQTSPGGPVFEYSAPGTPGSWTDIGGNPVSIVAG